MCLPVITCLISKSPTYVMSFIYQVIVGFVLWFYSPDNDVVYLRASFTSWPNAMVLLLLYSVHLMMIFIFLFLSCTSWPDTMVLLP